MKTEKEVPGTQEPKKEIKKELVKGVVVDCTLLAVRKSGDDYKDVIAIIEAGTEVQINQEHSNDRYYNIKTKSGIEGFCMRQYIKIK